MKKTRTGQDSRKNNPVAKHAREFNRSATFIDRKKAAKRGYERFKSAFRDQQDDSKTVLLKGVLLSSSVPG